MSFLYAFLRTLEPPTDINILMYHGFTDQTTFDGMANHHGKHLHVDKFGEQVRYLKDHYRIIALPDLVACISARKSIPPRSVVITIDDGYRSNFTLAYPVLKEFAAPAAIFTATDFIGRKSFLWTDRVEHALNTTKEKRLQVVLDGAACSYDLADRGSRQAADVDIKRRLKRSSACQRDPVVKDIEDKLGQRLSFGQNVPAMYAPLQPSEIREMTGSGLVSIGSHTCSHVIMTACPPEEMKAELQASKQHVEEWTARPCTLFSYPNGGTGDFNDASAKILKDLGYLCALTTIIGTNKASADIFKLKRLNIHNDGDMGGFVRTLSGLGRFLRRIKNAGPAREQY